MTSPALPAVLPAGTQIVLRVPVASDDGRPRTPQAVATIVGLVSAEEIAGSDQVYLVRFADGGTTRVSRRDFNVRRRVLEAAIRPASAFSNGILWERVVFKSVVGSRAYGLERADSDVDRRGAYVAPADLHWSLGGAPEQLENDVTQEVYWEIEKFLRLALRANPNVLECLYSPLVELETCVGRDLRALRSSFLSRLIYQTFSGYALSQFKKMEQDLRAWGAVNWKHAMHLLRVLLAGTVALREGMLPLDVGEHRARLLAIRAGEVPWEDVESWRRELHRQFDRAFEQTPLPEYPDVERANAFLISVRRRVAAGEQL